MARIQAETAAAGRRPVPKQGGGGPDEPGPKDGESGLMEAAAGYLRGAAEAVVNGSVRITMRMRRSKACGGSGKARIT